MQKAIYRIIDANFNRAREALRVTEDLCRFALDSKTLSSRAKQLRHQLSAQIEKLDSSKLLTARDTPNDVGTHTRVKDQLSRQTLHDCFTAAAKRLPEALRTLTETIQTFDPETAQAIENIRYDSYTLEKDINTFSNTSLRFEKVKLYVLITSSDHNKIISLTKNCAISGADCIQLRIKQSPLSDKQYLSIAKDFVNICHDNNVISIINDRPDIAITSDADGLHLGQDDLPIEEIKKIIPRPMIIGLSTHNTNQLAQAIKQQPTYVGLGPAFPTNTKPHEKVAGLDYISQALDLLKHTSIQHVAIGGISKDNLPQILSTGVQKIAVCSAITQQSDPKQHCSDFKKALLSV